ncbi:MAG: hypothetical protein K9H84_04510 [Bacteroidales bacterium]|nr:hypothetical protein [Bacteroidales bacterium]
MKSKTMAENKTKATTASVDAFIESIENEKKRKDSKAILRMMEDVTGEKPRMWGDSITKFGGIKDNFSGIIETPIVLKIIQTTLPNLVFRM